MNKHHDKDEAGNMISGLIKEIIIGWEGLRRGMIK